MKLRQSIFLIPIVSSFLTATAWSSEYSLDQPSQVAQDQAELAGIRPDREDRDRHHGDRNGHEPSHRRRYPGNPHRHYPPVSWPNVRTITCIASDSKGTQYSYTDRNYFGYGYLDQIAQIQQAAIDYCSAESQDAACTLTGCMAGY